MKYVILNADDFGSSSVANAAILRAHQEGVLTSASLMVAGEAADEAIRIARSTPRLAVGLHVAVSDAPAATAGRSSRLVERDGRLLANPARVGLLLAVSRACRDRAAEEVEEQFARFAASGLTFDHANGHQHLHLLPAVWRPFVECCARYGVRWVRLPCEPFRPHRRARRAVRLAEHAFLRALRSRCRADADARGLRYAERVYGQLETGHMTAEYTSALICRLEGQVAEVYFHPGTPHAQPLPGSDPPMDVELHALLSRELRESLARSGREITAYGRILR